MLADARAFPVCAPALESRRQRRVFAELVIDLTSGAEKMKMRRLPRRVCDHGRV